MSNNSNFSKEFIYQGFALILSIILVHAFYVSVVRPEASEIIQEQQTMIAQDINYIPERSFYVIISNYEQESCFVLMLWAFAIMTLKARSSVNERKLLQLDLIPLQRGENITYEDTDGFLRRLENLPESQQELLLPRILTNGLKRFATTKNVQDVSISTHTMVETEADRLESELSMIRYIAWAIPSIGFIGTVRGIGSALSLAHRAVDGDISGVTQNLGIAFNSTFIALLISIVIMFLVHQLQSLQERQVFETETYADQNLVTHLKSE
jgi:biopolymer transport protein ExbB/TolQ